MLVFAGAYSVPSVFAIAILSHSVFGALIDGIETCDSVNTHWDRIDKQIH